MDDDDTYLELPDQTPSAQEVIEQEELRSLIDEGLQTLRPQHREVLILRELHQRSYDEIAQVLDLDLGTVKSRINRGRRQLRNYLLQFGNFSGSQASKETEKEGCK